MSHDPTPAAAAAGAPVPPLPAGTKPLTLEERNRLMKWATGPHVPFDLDEPVMEMIHLEATVRALEQRLATTVRALISSHTHHYEPQFGGYCWCRAWRDSAFEPHEARCLEAREALASPAQEGG